MDNSNSKRMNAIKENISKMAQFAFNDYVDMDKEIRELNCGLIKSNEQTPTDVDELQKDQIVEDKFYNDFDDLNDDDDF